MPLRRPVGWGRPVHAFGFPDGAPDYGVNAVPKLSGTGQAHSTDADRVIVDFANTIRPTTFSRGARMTNRLYFTLAVNQSKYLSLEDDEVVPEPATGPDRVCPNPDCGYVSPATAAYCARCGRSLAEAA